MNRSGPTERLTPSLPVFDDKVIACCKKEEATWDSFEAIVNKFPTLQS